MILRRANKQELKPSALARIKRRRTRMFDFGLGLIGVAMAGLSSYLPYYVYFNESEFGPPEMQFTGRIDYEEPLIVEPGEETRTPLFREFAEFGLRSKSSKTAASRHRLSSNQPSERLRNSHR